MQFPKKEDERIALARAVVKGLEENPAIYPNPPVSAVDLQTMIADYDAKRALADQKRGEAEIATQEKDATLGNINYDSKTVLDWAERLVKGDDAQLKLLGWGGRAPSHKIQPPTQPTAFEILKPFDGGGFFDWKEPKLGGKVSSYIVRRSEDGAKFDDIKTVIESEATLFDQPRGKKLWYQVAAINAAGESEASNTVVMTF